MAIPCGERGFTYLTLMFAITLIGITLTAAAKPWKTVMQREREADLLAMGSEIQLAIGAYSTAKKIGRVVPGEVYPQSLEELTRPPAPFLRKVYRDPMTQGPFELVRAPSGGIMGVRSRSIAKPIRQHEFPPAVRHFDGMGKYRDWVFQHPNASGSTQALPGMAPMLGQPGMAVPPMPATTASPTPGVGSTQNLPGFQTSPSTPADPSALPGAPVENPEPPPLTN